MRAYGGLNSLFSRTKSIPTYNVMNQDISNQYVNPWNEYLASSHLSEPRDVKEFLSVMTYGISLPMLLHSEDRNSMGFGIEARVPFLGNDIANYCLGLPVDKRMSNLTTKLPLRKLLRRIAPLGYSNSRKKIGFATPEKRWFQGELRERVMSEYRETIADFPEIFDAEISERALQERLCNVVPWDFLVWRVISVGSWLRETGLKTY